MPNSQERHEVLFSFSCFFIILCFCNPSENDMPQSTGESFGKILSHSSASSVATESSSMIIVCY